VAEAALRHAAPLVIVPGVVDLQYEENRDVAFDMFSRLSLHPPVWVLGVVAVLTTLIVFITWLRRQNATWVEQTGFALICGGAIGNAMDRLLRGHVVDFIHVRFWPVFNLADALVVVGVGLLMLGTRRTPRIASGVGTR
jgi:signal peptidase II